MRRLDNLGCGDWGEAPGSQEASRRINKAQRLNVESDKRATRRRLHLREISEGAAHRSERVGSDLKATRVSLGYDLGAVAKALRIRRDHLEAVEESDLANLPGKAYAIGFIRSYADYLGLDSDECVRRFKEETKQLPDTGELVFPEVNEEVRLPHGVLAIVLFLLAVGTVWGILALTGVGNPNKTASVPPVPEELTTDTLAKGVVTLAGASGIVSTEADAATAPDDAAAKALPVDWEGPMPAHSRDATTLAALPEGFVGAWPRLKPQEGGAGTGSAATGDETAAPKVGEVYGQENRDARVVIQARVDAWLRIEDLTAGVLLERDLKAGDVYLVPNRPGIAMGARNAGAFNIILDGAPIGRAGPEGRALPAMLLDPPTLKPRASAATN
ncbi:MAG: helix-turn-helix domain-containing protein [Alphaproteobacteria bacterium]|nr:helix-turn-helix domain-containing protein [Alphaproteobacteria bacterium]